MLNVFGIKAECYMFLENSNEIIRQSFISPYNTYEDAVAALKATIFPYEKDNTFDVIKEIGAVVESFIAPKNINECYAYHLKIIPLEIGYLFLE
ncbi:MAG: hypothetical protein ACI4PE_03430 [Bacilli bacterium]